MAAANIVILSTANFDAEVLKSPLPVLVDFWAEWCGPCKMIGPLLDELAGTYAGKVKIAKVNIDEQNALAAEWHIQSIPTLLIFKEGQVIEQMIGAKGKAPLCVSLNNAITAVVPKAKA